MSTPNHLRPMGDHDLDEVLQLNADHVELLAELDRARLLQLREWASRADVVLCDGELAGFVLVFAPGSPYDSPNYRWFSAAYGQGFDYLDRIVVADRFRRRGLAGAVYDEVEASASARGRLTLEVNIDPPNTPSLAFHHGRGYVEVTQLGVPGHRVSLMAKELDGRPEGRGDLG